MSSKPKIQGSGPFRADQLHAGDRYELSDGHALFCAPTGRRGGLAQTGGAASVWSDPGTKAAGVDIGFTPQNKMLRAPDISVGEIPDAPGWADGVPPLAIEYADTGQDEAALAEKIEDLLQAGTKHIWVVRLTGPRRVEVFEPGLPMRTVYPGFELLASGVLRNPVLVESLYDPEASRRATLRNLLQREGYESLDAVRAEGVTEGRADGELRGKREALRSILNARGFLLRDADQKTIEECADGRRLERWIAQAVTVKSLEEVFG